MPLLYRSLITALVPLLFLGIGLLVTFWWFGFNRAQQLVRTSAQAQQQEIRQRVLSFIKVRQQMLGMLARRPEMRSGDRGVILSILTEEEALVPEVFEHLYLNTPDGMVYPTKSPPFQVNDRPYFAKVLKGEPVVGEVLVSRDTGATILLLIEPVMVDDQLVGAIAGSMVLDALFQRLASETSHRISGMVGILDQGTVLAGPEVLGEFAPLPEARSPEGARIRQRDRSLVGWVSGLEPVTWELVVAFDETELFSNLTNIWTLFLMLLILSFGIAALLSVALHQALTQPIINLARALDWLKPDETLQLTTQGPKEISELTESFNLMSARIRSEIHRREQVEHQLAQTQKQESLGRMARAIAHDFNNIVGAIGSLTELALESSKDEQQRQDLQGIQDAVKQGLQLTQQLSLFAGQGERQVEVFTLDSIWDQWRKPLKALFPPTVDFSIETGAGEAQVKITPNRLFQVLLNLCANAREALEEGPGQVEIRSSAENGEVAIRVADNGPGVPTQIKQQIFEPFFTTKKNGSGVGLATCYGIISSAEGTLALEETEGTVFVVRLPRVDS